LLNTEKRGTAVFDPEKTKEDLVAVFSTLDETAAAVARSILEDADIPCAVKGGFMNDITGISRLATIFTPGSQPVEVYVLESDAQEALSLLEELRSDADQGNG
jgi:hypothetical protein